MHIHNCIKSAFVVVRRVFICPEYISLLLIYFEPIPRKLRLWGASTSFGCWHLWRHLWRQIHYYSHVERAFWPQHKDVLGSYFWWLSGNSQILSIFEVNLFRWAISLIEHFYFNFPIIGSTGQLSSLANIIQLFTISPQPSRGLCPIWINLPNRPLSVQKPDFVFKTSTF